MLTLSNGSQVDEATMSGDAAPDPSVSGLMKVIKGLEGGDYNNRSGDSGSSAGAYQWNNDNKPLKPGELPSHWKSAAGQYLKDPSAPMTPENQNYVAYQQIKAYKDAGRTPMEIDALWNGAHKDSSGQYVHNSDARAQKFMEASNAQATQQPQGNGYVQAPTPHTPAPVDAPTSDDPNADPSGGFLQGLQEDASGTNPDSAGTQLENTVKGVGNFLFPAVGDVYHDIKGDSTKTGLQQAGDVGSTLLSAGTLIPGVGEGILGAKAAEAGLEGANAASKAGLLGSVGKNAALGGAFGATGAIGSGETDPTKIVESSALGAGTGGVLGAGSHILGETLDKAAGATPTSRLTEQTTRLKTLTKSLKDNSRPATDISGPTNPISTLATQKTESGKPWISLLKSPNGKVDATALTNAQGTGEIDNQIESHSAQASDLVKTLQGTVPLEDFRKAAEDAIKTDPGIRGGLNIPKELSLLDSKLASAKLSYGDKLPYTAIDEIRAGMNRGYNPDEMDTKRVIGDTARHFLYNGNGTNDAIKSAMANEAELIRARNFTEKLHGTSVPGGQLGKYFADLIGVGAGTAVGSMFGPLGEAVGAGVGGATTHKLAGLLQGRYFNPIGSGAADLLKKKSSGIIGKTARGAAKAGLLRDSGSLIQ